MRGVRRPCLALLCAGALALGGLRPALAQQDPRKPSPQAMAEAQQRYRRAIELVNESAYESALLEFRRAYNLAPSYRILFNIGQVSRALNDYATALRSFERYLKEGGADVPAEQAAEISKEIEVMRGRVARLNVVSAVDGTEIAVDDLVVGRTPLPEPIVINAGRRKVTARVVGWQTESKMVEAAGADFITLRFDAPSPQSTSERATEAAEPRRAEVPWALWGGTAALAIGATVTGVLSLRASADFRDLKDAPVTPERSGEYGDANEKLRRLTIATDVLAGLAVVTGGAALYFTLKSPSPPSGTGAKPEPVVLGLGPGLVQVRGAF